MADNNVVVTALNDQITAKRQEMDKLMGIVASLDDQKTRLQKQYEELSSSVKLLADAVAGMGGVVVGSE